ncbi:MAG: serine hydrolase [Deltaproteobacteria bacterium]|nr:serine hydrolase [Deltaproteobacteria bacterium]
MTDSSSLFDPADRLMRRGGSNQVFPGAMLLVLKDANVIFRRAYGAADIYSRRPVTGDTIFDLASLTKPLATSVAALMLLQDGQLQLTQPIGSVLPEFQGTDKAKIEIQHLLYHSAGLPAYRPYYSALSKLPLAERLPARQDMLVREALAYPVGTRFLYSDIGFMILRWVIETISGMRLDRFVQAAVYEPLGIGDLFFIDLSGEPPKRVFAATEWCPWRKSVLQGAVSDENAHVVGGIDGHAGLFGTGDALVQLLQELTTAFSGQSNRGLFQRAWLQKMFGRDPISKRALGFDMPTPGASSSGAYFSNQTVGHLGFTGTSFWMDLDRDISVILLTNRVHPTRDNPKIHAFRPQLHDAVMASLIR